jgi:hypothetical protein
VAVYYVVLLFNFQNCNSAVQQQYIWLDLKLGHKIRTFGDIKPNSLLAIIHPMRVEFNAGHTKFHPAVPTHYAAAFSAVIHLRKWRVQITLNVL